MPTGIFAQNQGPTSPACANATRMLEAATAQMSSARTVAAQQVVMTQLMTASTVRNIACASSQAGASGTGAPSGAGGASGTATNAAPLGTPIAAPGQMDSVRTALTPPGDPVGASPAPPGTPGAPGATGDSPAGPESLPLILPPPPVLNPSPLPVPRPYESVATESLCGGTLLETLKVQNYAFHSVTAAIERRATFAALQWTIDAYQTQCPNGFALRFPRALWADEHAGDPLQRRDLTGPSFP